MTKKTSFREKLTALFTGKRPFPKRLLLAFAPSLALSFTLLFFGPLDLSCISRDEITYSALDILPATGLVTGTAFLLLLLIAAIPGGKIHAFLVSLYTGLSLAVYLQGAFLNPNLGTLDGRTINWSSFSGLMLVNLAVWFVFLLIPHLVHYFSNRVWRRFVTLITAALVLMQAVSLTQKLLQQAQIDHQRSASYYLSAEDMFAIGQEKNIAVFLLDTTSNTDLDDMFAAYPERLSEFRDFTRYDNANTHYMYTIPSLISLLTGQEWDCENVSIRDYMNEAWHSPEAMEFYRTLQDQDYVHNFYMLLAEAANDPAVLKESFSNLRSSAKDTVINRQALVKLFKLSFYRYFPLALKPFFVIYTTELNGLVSAQDALINEWDFVARMSENAVHTGSSKNAFHFYYLAGTHKPYRMDARGRLIHSDAAPEFLTNYAEKEEQLSGFFYLINDYMRQLKEMGLYEETGIIILADHGNNEIADADHQPIYLVKRPGERRDAMETNSAPITIQERFLSEVIAMADGSPIPDLPDEKTERWTRAYAFDEALPPLPGAAYNVMREYRYSGGGDELIEAWQNGDYRTHPMLDSIY